MAKRWIVPAAILGAASVTAWHRLVTPWHERWGATDDEVAMALPGDDLVAEPAVSTTRAVGIDAPPEEVWPWIAQLGADRGGFYSYECLESLFGLGIHNADTIVPEWQERAVGELVAADAEGAGGWYVMEARPPEVLVLQAGDVKRGRPVRRDEALRWEFVWIFALRPVPGGGSRLVVRERVGFGSPLTAAAMSPLGIVSFVMTREMLRGIKARAEREAAGPARSVGRPT